MRTTRDVARLVEDGMENAALAMEEQRVGAATALTLDATDRVVFDAIADGTITRREWREIRTHLAVLREGLSQMLVLDERDQCIARRICGEADALARRAAGGRLVDAA